MKICNRFSIACALTVSLSWMACGAANVLSAGAGEIAPPLARPLATTPLSVVVTASASQLQIGRTITVTVALAGGEPACFEGLYQVSLTQPDPNRPLFEIAPYSHESFILKGVHTGVGSIGAQVEIEENCGDGWSMFPISGMSAPITVEPQITYIPLLLKRPAAVYYR